MRSETETTTSGNILDWLDRLFIDSSIQVGHLFQKRRNSIKLLL
jgi:hypothetical protein